MSGARACLVAVLGLLLSSGCPSASFEEHGIQSISGTPRISSDPAALTRAQPVPLLHVSPGSALAPEPRRFSVYARERRGETTIVSLLPVLPDGEPTADLRKLVDLAYRFGPGLELPLDVNTQVQVSLSASPNGGGKGLVIARENADGSATRAAIVSLDGGFAPDALPGLEVETDDGETIVYSEVRTEASGCAIALDHYALVVKAGEKTIVVPPGGMREVEHDGLTWSFVTLDASRPSDRFGEAQRCPSGAHVSWVMLARSGPGLATPPAP